MKTNKKEHTAGSKPRRGRKPKSSVRREADGIRRQEGKVGAAASIGSAIPGGGKPVDDATVRLVSLMLVNAVSAKVSDIHIERFETRSRVRGRVDGVLRDMNLIALDAIPEALRCLKTMAHFDPAGRLPQDGRILARIKGVDCDIRVTGMPMCGGEQMALRFMDRSCVCLDISSVAGPPIAKRLTEWAHRPSGLCLVTGPTGCGKTTTLYSMVKPLAADAALKVMTIEEPVELVMDGVCQMQVDPRSGFTIPSALRYMLRSAANVMMVSEFRDVETVQIAVAAAMAGHRVFGALHTSNAASAIVRLRDLGIEPFLICASHICVAGQRLVRRLCPECRAKGKPNPMALEALGLAEDALGGPVYGPKGCDKCAGSGYRGRTAVFELYEPGEDVFPLLQRGATSEEIRKFEIGKGFKTMVDNGLDLVREGQTSLEEVARQLIGA